MPRPKHVEEYSEGEFGYYTKRREVTFETGGIKRRLGSLLITAPRIYIDWPRWAYRHWTGSPRNYWDWLTGNVYEQEDIQVHKPEPRHTKRRWS